jgi:hypothetical protein
MKMIVKLAILFSMLLLLTGVSFAGGCPCYEVTATEVDNPTHTHTAFAGICFDTNESGHVNSLLGAINFSMFFDSMKDQILGYADIQGLGVCVGYFKFHGDDLYIIKGIGYCDGDRWQVWGHQADWENCP